MTWTVGESNAEAPKGTQLDPLGERLLPLQLGHRVELAGAQDVVLYEQDELDGGAS